MALLYAPAHLLREITQFFQIYKELEGKETRVGDWKDQTAARRTIRAASERYRERANFRR